MGIIAVYGFLFGIGKLIYGELAIGIALLVVGTALGLKLVLSKSIGGKI